MGVRKITCWRKWQQSFIKNGTLRWSWKFQGWEMRLFENIAIQKVIWMKGFGRLVFKNQGWWNEKKKKRKATRGHQDLHAKGGHASFQPNPTPVTFIWFKPRRNSQLPWSWSFGMNGFLFCYMECMCPFHRTNQVWQHNPIGLCHSFWEPYVLLLK